MVPSPLMQKVPLPWVQLVEPPQRARVVLVATVQEQTLPMAAQAVFLSLVALAILVSQAVVLVSQRPPIQGPAAAAVESI